MSAASLHTLAMSAPVKPENRHNFLYFKKCNYFKYVIYFLCVKIRWWVNIFINMYIIYFLYINKLLLQSRLM